MADEKSVFVTVGTTSFDRLIETVSSKPLIEVNYKTSFSLQSYNRTQGHLIKVLNRSSSVARQCPFNTYSILRLNSIHCCRHNYIFFFILQVLENLGYRSVILQIGRGVYEPEIMKRNNFSLTYYRYKDSIAADIQRASLVISHAGQLNSFLMVSTLTINTIKPNLVVEKLTY